MELVPKDIEATLPPLYSQDNVSDPVAVIKSSIRWADAPSTFWKVAASLTVTFFSSGIRGR
jgi:hypothetical protein